MPIFDLTQLRGVTSLPVAFEETVRATGEGAVQTRLVTLSK